MPRVSVIVPTYNRAALVAETARSVLAQTLRDLELIVVDDGSSDDTAERIEALDDPRVRYLRQERSGRPAVGRNRGIEAAGGALVAFIDDDDLWRPTKLERQLEGLAARPAAGLCYTNALRFVDDPARPGSTPMIPPGAGLEGRVAERLYGRPSVPNLTVLLRREVLDAVGGFSEEVALAGCEDYELWLRVATRFEFAYVDEPLALYRVNPAGSISQSLAFFHAQIALIEHVDRLHPELAARCADERRRWLARSHGQLGRAALRRGERSVARRALRESLRLAPSPKNTLAWLASFVPRARPR